MDGGKQFNQIERQKLAFAVNPSLVFSICPTMDLIAFSSGDGSVWIYRIDGERIWILNSPNSEIDMLVWRPDGKMLAVVSTDGLVSVFDSNTGSLVTTLNNHLKSVETIIWSKRSSKFGANGKFDNLFEINLSKSLIKLSTLPSGSTSSTFTAKIINDEMIQCDDSTLDFLISTGDNGKLTFTLYGLFTLEEFQIPQLENNYVMMLDMRSNELLTSHYILFENEKGLGLLKLDTPFVESFGSMLPTVSLACSKVVGLLKYLQETISILVSESKPFIEYTRKIMDLLKDEIIEKNKEDSNAPNESDIDPIDDLYDVLLTGEINAACTTWLTDYLGERGLDRWLRLSKQCYDGCRKVLFNHMALSLEHLLVLLNNLLGYARWNKPSSKTFLGLHEEILNEAIDSASSLMKAVYKMIFVLNEEHVGFESFIYWLSDVLREITDDEPVIDDMERTKEISEYMTKSLTHPKLHKFLKIDQPTAAAGEEAQASVPAFKDEDVRLDVLYDKLTGTCDELFAGVKKNMKSKIVCDKVINFSDFTTNIAQHKLDILYDSNYQTEIGALLLFNDNIKSFRLCLVNLLDLSLDIREIKLDNLFELETNVLKIEGEFADDKQLLLMVSYNRNIGDASSGSKAKSVKLLKIDLMSIVLGNDMKTHVIAFDDILKENEYNIFHKSENKDIPFVPKFMAVNGVESRRLICLLDETKKNYTLLDID